MKTKHTFMAVTAALVMFSCGEPQTNTVSLFNGTDLTGWIPYLQDSTKNASQEFVVKDSVIVMSGTYGYLRTEAVYSNYILDVEWRWPDSATNSGIFVNVEGDGIWPDGYECQLMAGKAGDLINSGGADCALYRADSAQMIVAKLNASNEKPLGEWNQAEIVCTDSTVMVTINGLVQNKIDGISNKQGSIGLQSEGGPIEFRNVMLTPLKR